ncbi:MAG: ATP-grasp domain-containing protein [Vampirovibrio sp.]|nr:ATP-grasp domain-containing protein [Vampirovibrio sp.]
MFLLDQPYVSDFLKETLLQHQIPVIKTPAAEVFELPEGVQFVSEADAISMFRQHPNTRLLTNSENALGWVAEHLPFTDLPGAADIFKNKVKFRILMRPYFPTVEYQSVPYTDLHALKLEDTIPMPFVLKPAVGFFSLGVYPIYTPQDWQAALASLKQEVAQAQSLYPNAVLDTSTFILETLVQGREFAFDAYYGEDGQPVVLNVFEHLFSGAEDVSDRVYMTNKALMQEFLPQFTEFLHMLNHQLALKNVVIHVEVRLTNEGVIIPIEVNPLRFGGWCTTADVTPHACGFNPYVSFFKQQAPDWPKILAGMGDETYSLVVLDKPGHLRNGQPVLFDWDAVLATFSNPLAHRVIQDPHHPVFGFVFAKTQPNQLTELHQILNANLTQYVKTLQTTAAM